jgi:ligand-binding sensor domain-containing protein
MKITLLAAAAVLIGATSFAQTFTNYTTVDGLLSDNVICLDVDASDAIWFGTQLGVSVFDGVTWTDHTVALDSGLVDNNILAIYVASSGDVWAGTDFGASVYSGGSWTTYTTADGLGNNQIKCITEDLDGDIWFGTNNGASEFNGTTWTSLGTAEGLPFGGVATMTVHSNGDIWMGTGLSGVKIYDGAAFTELTTADGLVDDRIRSILFDSADERWVATSEGISVFDNGNAHSTNHTIIFTLPAPDTLNPMEDLKMDSEGIVWAGVYVDYLVTEGGVCAYNGNDWIEFHESDGLIGPVVRALAIDGTDAVWIATSTGVSKLTDHSVGITTPDAITNFSVYPNPVKDLLTLSFSDESEVSNIEIYATSMQLVKSISLDANQNEISFSVADLTSGVYFVRAGATTQKVLVQ